ncbi:V-type H+-transporting ATPase subunit C [Nematocida displodere]|uniref:V-type proton ATPase subunit C n=1 Tax=Nematocida displodere TaxID=1805483 RepID=A0A177EID5_9MICR|nr:V-type H+-transporting ATPase subunit C [Nematocida displodere]
MHILVSLPLDEPVEEDILLSNVRRGLGSSGKDCDSLALPGIESESIDCLFDAEERVSALETLAQDTIRKYLAAYNAISEAPVSDTQILGKTFDHFLKTFAWNSTKYPQSTKITDLLSSMEQELATAIEAYSEKNRMYLNEKKKKEALSRRRSGSIYDLDINTIAYKEGELTANSFFRKYYLGIREKLREKDVEKLESIEGLFVESRNCVFKGTDGEVYEILGRSGAKEEVLKDLEKQGYYVKEQAETYAEYLKLCEQDEEALVQFEQVRNAVFLLVSANLQKLYGLLVHTKHLGVYIESILRFGLPSTFCFFILEFKNQGKVLSKWKKLAKTWKYSKRVTTVDKKISSSSAESVYDFVYKIVAGFEMSPSEEAAGEI